MLKDIISLEVKVISHGLTVLLQPANLLVTNPELHACRRPLFRLPRDILSLQLGDVVVLCTLTFWTAGSKGSWICRLGKARRDRKGRGLVVQKKEGPSPRLLFLVLPLCTCKRSLFAPPKTRAGRKGNTTAAIRAAFRYSVLDYFHLLDRPLSENRSFALRTIFNQPIPSSPTPSPPHCACCGRGRLRRLCNDHTAVPAKT